MCIVHVCWIVLAINTYAWLKHINVCMHALLLYLYKYCNNLCRYACIVISFFNWAMASKNYILTIMTLLLHCLWLAAYFKSRVKFIHVVIQLTSMHMNATHLVSMLLLNLLIKRFTVRYCITKGMLEKFRNATKIR